jgi:uncharacterized membrane protein YgaE (UPF0421/DUF939 family)
VNYALYTAAIAASVPIAIDPPHPSNLGAEGQRVLHTFCGVGIAVIVMLLVNPPKARRQSHVSLGRDVCGRCRTAVTSTSRIG